MIRIIDENDSYLQSFFLKKDKKLTFLIGCA